MKDASNKLFRTIVRKERRLVKSLYRLYDMMQDRLVDKTLRALYHSK